MIYERIALRDDNPDVYLDCYCFNEGRTPCDGILVIPGGGYKFVSPREGEPIAQAFASQGFNSFVLHYSIRENAVYPNPLLDAALAMKHIRTHAERYRINAERVFAVGFSAGGHLCGMLGNLWHRPEIAEYAKTESQTIRPKGVMLIYPVMVSGVYAHQGSIINVSGGKDELLDTVSLDKQVSSLSAPAFFMHTANDGLVPVENTLLSAMAYRSAGVPFEVHIYPFGPHGISLATDATAEGNPAMTDTEISKWVELAAAWSRRF